MINNDINKTIALRTKTFTKAEGVILTNFSSREKKTYKKKLDIKILSPVENIKFN